MPTKALEVVKVPGTVQLFVYPGSPMVPEMPLVVMVSVNVTGPVTPNPTGLYAWLEMSRLTWLDCAPPVHHDCSTMYSPAISKVFWTPICSLRKLTGIRLHDRVGAVTVVCSVVPGARRKAYPDSPGSCWTRPGV